MRKSGFIVAFALSALIALARAESPQQSAPAGGPAASYTRDAGPAWADAHALPSNDERARASDDARARSATRALLASLTAKDAGVATPAAEQPSDPGRLLPRASVLGIPPAPRSPKPRTQFDFAADDPAGRAARAIAERVATFPNLRAQAPGAAWREDARARFALRGSDACMTALARAGIRAHPLVRELSTPVPTAVVIDAPIEGVAFVSLHADRDIELSCEMALKLRALARVLKAHGVLAVGVNSSYRDRPKISFHTFGLALDLMAFRTESETLVVADDFEINADLHTCDALPERGRGKALLAIVCAIAESRVFSTVLTPNYNEGHRDHVHLDARPDDPRLFVR